MPKRLCITTWGVPRSSIARPLKPRPNSPLLHTQLYAPTCLFLEPALTPWRSSASITEEWPCLQVKRAHKQA